MTVRQFLDIVEIRTKVISVSTYLVATLYVAWSGFQVRPGIAVLLAVSMLCVDMGTTAFNTFYDYMHGVDSKDHSRERGKVLVHEGVAPGHALIVSVILYLVAAATGIVLGALSTWWIVPAGAAGLAIGYLYNGGPLPISRTPVGEIFAGGALGSLLFLVVVAVHTGTVGWPALLVSLPSTLVIAAVLTVNNTCDMDGDRAAGRRTLSIVFGRKAGEVLVYLQGFIAYALLILFSLAQWLNWLNWSTRLPRFGWIVAAAGLAATALIYRRMHALGYSHETKHAHMVAVSRVVLLYTAVYALILVSGLVFA